MDDTISLRDWIIWRRKVLDLTQEELARQVGCSVVTIRKIEAGYRRPSKQIAERLADCLEVAQEDRAIFLQAVRTELIAKRLGVPTKFMFRLMASYQNPSRSSVRRSQKR